MTYKQKILTLVVSLGICSAGLFLYVFAGNRDRTPPPSSQDAPNHVSETPETGMTKDNRFLELQKTINEFEKKPFLAGTLVSEGKTYNFQYRCFDRPLDLVIPYACPYELGQSGLRSELSLTSLWHDKDPTSPGLLQKWKNAHLPECRERVDKIIKDVTQANNMPASDYLSYFSKHQRTYNVLGEIRYENYHIIIVQLGKKPVFTYGIHYIKDSKGLYIRDIRDYRGNVVLFGLSQDEYSIITNAFKD